MNSPKFIAHHRKTDGTVQSVKEHLQNVSAICGRLTRKIDAQDAGKLLGLLHDLGKYGLDFQNYIQSATEMLDPDRDDAWVDADKLKGKIDHSTAGAQWVWQRFLKHGEQGRLIAQILAVCLASHHGGMLDCLLPGGENGFEKRICKNDDKTNLSECLRSCDEEISTNLEEIATINFLKDFWPKLVSIYSPEKNEPERLKAFRLGFYSRFLFSCLVDADRIDSTDFEMPSNKKHRPSGKVSWKTAIERLEAHLAQFKVRNGVDEIRNKISVQCLQRSGDPQGIYTLTVPTGGGKTFSSIRYGLHHARKYKLDHIFYIIPYTSIIEQNAQVIREIVEKDNDEFPWVLEHHSNLEPEQQTWKTKLSSENWDAPIIFTTMVQFLEVLFGGGTRGARRLHNLANSLIIFDEIQTLPVNCVHLFNNALQFLADHAGSTALLCTATQPLLGGVNSEYGALEIPHQNELIDDTTKLFVDLKRVEIIDRTKNGGWSETELIDLAIEQLHEKGNCLVIVNTKVWAQKLYQRCSEILNQNSVFHLSTSLCPAHRKEILKEVTDRLDPAMPKPVLCISTQLIEAGVDVDFNSVIRFLAGLDSIAQAAGRCNRNGNLHSSEVFVVNPAEEAITMLKDIKIGQEKAKRVLSESEHNDFLSPSAINRYFSYYFYERQTEESNPMLYPLSAREVGRTDTLINLLSDNKLNVGREPNPGKAIFKLQQSFKTAGRAFEAIDAPTQAVIVPYGEGKMIIAGLCADYEPAKAYQLLKKAQKYSVNVFPNVWQELVKKRAVSPVQEGEAIFYLDERYYSKDFGVSTEVVAEMDTQII